MPATVSVLHHLARSGGTLISKCLGCMDGIVLLGETHPAATIDVFNPLWQAQAWHRLFTAADLRMLEQRPTTTWLDAIAIVHEKVAARGMRLLIRDWSHLDFIGVPWVENPRLQFTTSITLAERFATVATTTVRHPLDQWVSLEKLPLIRSKLTVAGFLTGYRAFAERVVERGFVRFEDFTADPPGCARMTSLH